MEFKILEMRLFPTEFDLWFSIEIDDSHQSEEGHQMISNFWIIYFVCTLPRKVTGSGTEREIESQSADSVGELKIVFFIRMVPILHTDRI